MNYRSFKQELRHRFKLRCGHCGIHESLFPDGELAFGIDHFRPKDRYPDLANDPLNLVYACRACNAAKGAMDDDRMLNPNCDKIPDHLKFEKDGRVAGITERGRFTAHALGLNRDSMVEARRRVLVLVELLDKHFSPSAAKPVADLANDELDEFFKTVREVGEGWGVFSTTRDEPNSVAFVVGMMAASLCELIAKQPQALDEVEWRDLERVVAVALEKIGFTVTLTPPAKDGGKDVVANCFVQSSTKVFYIEIKHWRKGDRPGTRQVSDFVEINARDRTDGGLFLSSSGFTDLVYRQLGNITRERIRLGERDKIVSICQYYVKKQQGIWQPLSLLPDVLFENTLGRMAGRRCW